MIRLEYGDCLDVMDTLIKEGIKVDCVITDPPYGTTGQMWDDIIPIADMWDKLLSITKEDGAIVLFGSEPFSSLLRLSEPKLYKYDWVWLKNTPTGMAQANYMPMKYHEYIHVFYRKKPTFNKQMIPREGEGKSCYKYEHYCGDSNHVKMKKVKKHYDEELVNPSSVLLFNTVPNRKGKVHPTQKPTALLEYLIKTYTNKGEIILDFTMGSGSTGVACINTGRKFIGIENYEKFFDVAKERISVSDNLESFM